MPKACWISGLVLALWGAVAMAQPAAATPDAAAESAQVDPNDSGPAAPVEPSDYWLGIACSPVPPSLRTQLDLPEEQGLLVQAVVPDSPAANAGIEQYDFLLRADDKPLAEPSDLVAVIETVKDGTLRIDLIRDGQAKTVEATPSKRPEEARRSVGVMPDSNDWQTMERWLQTIRPGTESDGRRPPMHFRFVHPGAIVPRDALVASPLPPNMSVVISKEGDQPAKIVVKRGDEKWETTETDLDKLPADVRPHVERMLGRGLFGVVGNLPAFTFVPKETPTGDLPPFDFAPKEVPDVEGPRGLVPAPEMRPPRGPDLLERMEKRFDEMNRRMDKLLGAVERLHEGRASHEVPGNPTEQHQK